MSNNEVVTQPTVPPFARNQLGAHANVGAVAIEQERAIAEAQGQMILAKRFPRNEAQALEEMMRACKSKAFADTAFYTIKNRGTGPTIRFAEEVSRCYGNFQYGHRELSRSEGKSEIEVYAWDVERNNRNSRQVTVLHVRDANGETKKLTTQDDIDARISNVASKQVRSRILALVPKWLVAEAILECKKTIAGNNDVPLADRIMKMQKTFAALQVTVKQLESYLGHQMSDTTPDEIAELTGVYNSIKEGTPISEHFSIPEPITAPEAQKDAVTAAAAMPKAEPPFKQPKKEKPKAEAVPEPELRVADVLKAVLPEPTKPEQLPDEEDDLF